MYTSGNFLNFHNRLHQFPNSGYDISQFQIEGNNYNLLNSGISFYSGLVTKWNREFQHKVLNISGVSTTGNYIVRSDGSTGVKEITLIDYNISAIAAYQTYINIYNATGLVNIQYDIQTAEQTAIEVNSAADGTTFANGGGQPGQYFAFSNNGSVYGVYFVVDGQEIQPDDGGVASWTTCNIASIDVASAISSNINGILNGLGLNVAATSTYVNTITNQSTGNVGNPPNNSTAGLTITRPVTGISYDTYLPANCNYLITIDLEQHDSLAVLIGKTQTGINTSGLFDVSVIGNSLRLTDKYVGARTDATVSGTALITATVTTQGQNPS